jgi:hypothetical protein
MPTRWQNPAPEPRRHAPRILAAIALAGAAASAFAGYNIWTGEYTFTTKELQTVVEQRFPTKLRYAQVLDVQLSNPHLVMDEANNRITTQVDAVVTNTLLPAPPINGTLAVNSGIRYDPARRAVLLDNPSVERVDVSGVPSQYGQQMSAIGTLVAQQVLKDYPLHTFKPEELRVGGKEVVPGEITVVADGIKVKVDTK